MTTRRVPYRKTVLLLAMLAAGRVVAMEEIGEAELSTVTGQEGVEIQLGTNTITATRLRLDVDNPNAAFPGYNAYFDLEGLTLTGVNLGGTSTGLATTIAATVDVGAPAQTGATPGVALNASWGRTRFLVNALRHQSAPTKSFGSLAFDSSGSVQIIGDVGLFDGLGSTSQARLILSQGDLYYRQNGNEFLWDNLNANIGFTAGKLGLTNAGLVLTTNRLDFSAEWDIGYRANVSAANAYKSTLGDYIPYLHYGWGGGLKDVSATISGGGIAVGATRTQGLHLSYQANADTDFKWIIGDAGATPASLDFTTWVNFPGVTTGLTLPDVTIDVVNATQGSGGFLYKGVNTNTLFATAPPDAGALAVVIRNASFLNYNTKVTLHDSPNPDKVFNWALIYTLGDLDLDLYAYPGGKAAAAEGVRFDLALGVQSPGTWSSNTHFLIADTDPTKNVGVGFLNTNFLITINDGYLTLLPTGAEIETTSDFRWRLDGQFGGGFLNDLSKPVRMVDIDLDLHTSFINVLFKPPPAGQKYIGFQWDAHFYQSNTAVTPAGIATADSYISMAEPSKPTVKFTLGQISGDIETMNGKIDIMASSESADGYPRLKFEQDLRFGLTGGTQPLIINNLAIGTNQIGSLAIPGGNWYGALALKEQL